LGNLKLIVLGIPLEPYSGYSLNCWIVERSTENFSNKGVQIIASSLRDPSTIYQKYISKKA